MERGGAAMREVPAFDQRVERRHQLLPGGGSQQCGIVADAQHHTTAPVLRSVRSAEVAIDQFEFTQRHSRVPLMLVGSQLARGPVHHGVDELVAVGGAEAPRQPHRLADHHAERHFGMGAQLLHADQQRRVLDRIELRRRPVAPARQLRIQRRAVVG